MNKEKSALQIKLESLATEFNVDCAMGDPILAMMEAYKLGQQDCNALRELLDRPEINNFIEGVKIEAAHQLKRWGTEQDRSKSPEDWYWTIGYLAGKALHAQRADDDGKFMHHLITTAAVLANWHYFASNPDPLEWEKDSTK